MEEWEPVAVIRRLLDGTFNWEVRTTLTHTWPSLATPWLAC